jgi:hypothetical protein
MTPPQTWIQPVENQLKEILDLPDFSWNASFSLSDFSSFISSRLGISPLSIELGESGWKTKDSYFAGLGSSPISASLQMSPLEGDCFWITPYEDLETLVSWISDKNQKTLELNNPDLIKGVYRYVLLIALEALGQTELFKQFSLKLTKDVKPEEQGYAIDVALIHGEKRIWARLVLSRDFKESFMRYFAKEKLSLTDLSKKFPHLSVPLKIVNGSFELSKEELLSLETGDFVLIDNAFYKPTAKNGSLKMLLNDTPLFQVKLKEGKFKILDFIYAYNEVPVDAE